VLSEEIADLGPQRQEHALAFVVACAIRMGLAEIPGSDGAIDRGDDLGHRDVFGISGQDVATTDATLGAHDARALEGQENLLQVGLGEPGPLGDVSNRRWAGLRSVEGKGEERSAGVVTSRRYLHAHSLPIWSGIDRNEDWAEVADSLP